MKKDARALPAPPPLRPKTLEDWDSLYADVTEAFSDGEPIRERDLFAGRMEEITQLIDAVRRRGRHAIVFGERGVGKTSLANTFALGLRSSTQTLIIQKVNASPNDTFTTLWRRVFRRLGYTIEVGGERVRRFVSDDYPGEISPDDVAIELQNFSLNSTPIIIIDEFDCIENNDVSLLTASMIKNFSDESVRSTIVIVGVAENVSDLIENHKSISRQLIQVRMPRMSRIESSKIILDRYHQNGLAIGEEPLWRITFMSTGLPYFTHLLGMHSARAAVTKRRTRVTDEDVDDGIKASLKEIDQTLMETYSKAVASKKPSKDTLYEPVLLACALARVDDLGRFQQKDVEQPLGAVIPGRPYRATTFAFHMNEFCDEKRGPVLQRSGEEQSPRYRFVDTMMQPYVILRGLSDGRINRQINETFMPRRQPLLSSDL